MKRVLCIGCFDCLHVGHVAHLQAAARLGDELIVGLTVDDAVGKGAGRPVFSYNERNLMLLGLRCVTCVIPHESMEQTLRRAAPHIYAKGMEYANALPELELCRTLGIQVVYLDTQPVYHSSDIMSGKLLHDRIRTAQQCSPQESPAGR